MASRFIEDSHRSRINEILAIRGLECNRSPAISTEDLSSVLMEEQVVEEEEEAHPEVPQEETEVEALEEFVEEEKIFPTPSLRHLYPDKIRRIEELNRLYVLPQDFRTDIDPAAIPKIAVTPPHEYIDIIAELLGCKKYKSSMAEFWFLDTMAGLLRRAQEDLLDRPTQATLMLWFCEWMKEIQHFDAADRPRMMRRFKDNMLSAARFIAEESRLPTPEDVGVRYKAVEDVTDGKSLAAMLDTKLSKGDGKSKAAMLDTKLSKGDGKSQAAVLDTKLAKGGVKSQPAMVEAKRSKTSKSEAMLGMQSSTPITFEGTSYACAIADLMKIMHYIFDLFSTDFQFDLVRSVFTYTPEYELIIAPYQIQTPKRIYAPMKPGKKEKTAKKDQGKGKGKKKEVESAEYLALMELKAKEERELEELEERRREEWNRRSHILPLNFAATDELFDRYWPPPPEPPAEPEAKPKKGKK